MERNKQAAILAFIVVFIIPLFLFLYWFKRPRPLVPVLPVLSTYDVVESRDAEGNIAFDTIYQTIPDFELISHMGDTIDESIMERKIVIAGYFHTNCTDVCLDVTGHLRYLQDIYANQDSLQFLYHAVNPVYDTIAQLYEYAKVHYVNNSKWLLLSGNKEVLVNLASNGYHLSKVEDTGDHFHDLYGRDVNCGKLVLIDKDKLIRGYYDGTDSVDIERLRLDTKRIFLTSDFPHTRLNSTNRK